ncbi:MAG: S1C family serine protease [Sandaracinaceae bacterium]|nr:S1C family serine protease [Sandaracinaceae bacterium]
MTRRLDARLPLVLLLATLGASLAGPAHAQVRHDAPAPTAPSSPPAGEASAAVALDYSVIDRATVRVFAVHGVGTAAIPTSRGARRLLALPESSHGSGLLVSADGLIVTARHVVNDGNLLAVWVPGHERAFEAHVVHVDETWDLAILAIQGTFTDFVPIAPLGRALHIREQVSAIGYPLDASRTDPQSAQGIVSGVLPSGELQLDIGVNPGNSGGPLIDAQEHVVGIVVARGDVEQGVQSIGVAVPVDPIAQLLTTMTPDFGPLATARLGLTSDAHSAEVAELVQTLVRVQGAELYRDVERALEGRGTGEVLARLRRFADSAQDAETMALLAAYFWDAAALVLERNGGALMASELAAGPDRDLASDLLRRAVRLCFEAQRRDLAITTRSPFVAWVTYYLREPGAAAPAAATPPAASARPITAGAVAERPSTPPRPRTAEELVRERDHRLHVFVDLLLPFAGPETTFAGFAPSVGLSGSPYTLRVGIVALDLWLGATLGLHYVGSGVARGARLYLGLDLGGSVRIGDVNGFVIAGAWTPAELLMFSNGATGALGAGRLRVGAQIGSAQLGLEWHGYQPDGDYVVHAFGLYIDSGFLQ